MTRIAGLLTFAMIALGLLTTPDEANAPSARGGGVIVLASG